MKYFLKCAVVWTFSLHAVAVEAPPVSGVDLGTLLDGAVERLYDVTVHGGAEDAVVGEMRRLGHSEEGIETFQKDMTGFEKGYLQKVSFRREGTGIVVALPGEGETRIDFGNLLSSGTVSVDGRDIPAEAVTDYRRIKRALASGDGSPFSMVLELMVPPAWAAGTDDQTMSILLFLSAMILAVVGFDILLASRGLIDQTLLLAIGRRRQLQERQVREAELYVQRQQAQTRPPVAARPASRPPVAARPPDPSVATARIPLSVKDLRGEVMKSIAEGDHTRLDSLLANPHVVVNFKEPGRGWTPLMAAAAVGDRVAIGKLLKAGAKVNERADTGMTAYWIAFEHGQQRTALDLLAAGTDVRLDFSLTHLCTTKLQKFLR